LIAIQIEVLFEAEKDTSDYAAAIVLMMVFRDSWLVYQGIVRVWKAAGFGLMLTSAWRIVSRCWYLQWQWHN